MITFISTNMIYRRGKRKKVWLSFGIIGIVSVLALLKYSAFFVSTVNCVVDLVGFDINQLVLPQWVAPIGISFYSLSAIGFLLDVYWGKSKPNRNVLKVMLFICYWPIMTSGPIIKYDAFNEEVYKSHRLNFNQVLFGIQRMLWGIIKKIVIASRLGIIVDTIYGDLTKYDGLYIWIAAVFFLIQLYADFSGCMDIIIGASECYGVRLPENFNRPLFSKNIQEYWQRWHITLGGWFKDYILYPLLNSKPFVKLEKSIKKRCGLKTSRLVASGIAMMIVWLLIGLWHGGEWKYVIMGLYFWFVIMLEKIVHNPLKKLGNRFGIQTDTIGLKVLNCIKVIMLSSVGNMLFRLNNTKDAIATLLSGTISNPWIVCDGSLYELGLSPKSLFLVLVLVFVLLLVSLYGRNGNVRVMISEWPLLTRWTIYYGLILIPIIFGVYGPGFDAQTFIYGRF